MMENVAISGVQLINESTISVTLRHDIENNAVLPVTVIAYKISLNNSDIGSVMQSASNSNNFMGFNPSMNSLQRIMALVVYLKNRVLVLKRTKKIHWQFLIRFRLEVVA